MKYIPIIVICLLIYGPVNVVAQKKPESRHKAPEQPEGRVIFPYRVEVTGVSAYPPEIVLGIGRATVFHLPEPAYQVIFGNMKEIAHAEANEETGRHDIYVRAVIPNLRTNMIFEFKTGTLILNVRTVDRRGGVRPGDYHGEVFIKPQAINRPVAPRGGDPAPQQKLPGQQREAKDTKEPDRRPESTQQPESQAGLKNTQSDPAKAQESFDVTRKKGAAPMENTPNVELTGVSRKLQRRIELLESSLKERDAAFGAMEALLQNSTFKIKKAIANDGVFCGQFGKVTVDELGRYWIGVYLMNTNQSDLTLQSIQDPDNKTTMLYWSGRFTGKNSATLRCNEEAFFFVSLLPFAKGATKPSAIELAFNSGRNLKLEVE